MSIPPGRVEPTKCQSHQRSLPSAHHQSRQIAATDTSGLLCLQSDATNPSGACPLLFLCLARSNFGLWFGSGRELHNRGFGSKQVRLHDLIWFHAVILASGVGEASRDENRAAGWRCSTSDTPETASPNAVMPDAGVGVGEASRNENHTALQAANFWRISARAASASGVWGS